MILEFAASIIGPQIVSQPFEKICENITYIYNRMYTTDC